MQSLFINGFLKNIDEFDNLPTAQELTKDIRSKIAKEMQDSEVVRIRKKQ